MALFTVTSTTGSSGATTAVVGMMLTWPQPLIVIEADPSGGSAILAGYFRGLARPGLSELVLAHRQHQLAAELELTLFPVADSQARFLPGIRSPLQATTVSGVWESLLVALRAMGDQGFDILVDAGRLGLTGSPEPLLADADVTVVVSGSGLPELAAVRAWLPWLNRGAAELQLALAAPGHPYQASEVQQDLGIPVVGTIPWAPDAARAWSHGDPVRARRKPSAFVRSIEALGESLRARVSEAPALGVTTS